MQPHVTVVSAITERHLDVLGSLLLKKNTQSDWHFTYSDPSYLYIYIKPVAYTKR